MKKNILSKFIGLGILSLALLSACATKTEVKVEETKKEEVQEEKDLKNLLGLGVVINTQRTKDATDEQNSKAYVDTTVAGILFDAEGTILDLDIDVLKAKVEIDKDGNILTNLSEEVKTGKELADSYGMKNASGIKKELFEQIEFLEAYFKGKNVSAVYEVKLDSESFAVDEDIRSGATIRLNDYIRAVQKAIENSSSVMAKKDDKLSLAINSNYFGTKTIEDEQDGLLAFNNNYAVLTLSKDKKISSAIIDASTVNMVFTVDGEVLKEEENFTKLELGSDYGMKKASSISKEWDEQIKALSIYILGKDVKEVAKLDKDKDVDLSSSVTMSIDGYKAVVEKAINKIK